MSEETEVQPPEAPKPVKNKGGRPRGSRNRPIAVPTNWDEITGLLWRAARKKGASLGDVTRACQLLYEVTAKLQHAKLEQLPTEVLEARLRLIEGGSSGA